MTRGRVACLLVIAALLLVWSMRRGSSEAGSRPAELPPSERGPCVTALDCPPNSALPATCSDPAHCQGTRADVPRTAVPIAGHPEETRCDSDRHCQPDGYCEAGSCQPALPDGAACLRAAMCEGRRCGQGTCCSSGFCCRDPADCPARFDCIDITECRGTRTDRTCRDFSCVDTAIVDDNQGCAGQIARSCGPYAAVRCIPHQPAGRCEQTCKSQSDCQPGNACVAGACQDGCTEDAECDADQLCINHVCMRRCSEEEPCPSRLMCLSILDRNAPDSRAPEVCVDL